MYTLPTLPYAFNALEPFIDERTMQIHHDKHHATYIKNLNDALASIQQNEDRPIEELLKTLDQIPESIRMKVRNNGGGHANHSLFWQIMAPPSKQQPTGNVLAAIKSAFGSLETFQEKFAAAGLSRFGSGWVWLVSEKGTLSILDTPNQDTPIMEHKTPILGLDVWEHAYYLTYQNMRAEYIKNWWHVINWEEVGRRFGSTI